MNDILTAVLYPPAVTVRLRPNLLMSNFPVSHLFNRLLQGEFKIFGLSFHTSQRLSEILWIPTIPLLCIYRLTLSQILFAVNHLFPNKRKRFISAKYFLFYRENPCGILLAVVII